MANQQIVSYMEWSNVSKILCAKPSCPKGHMGVALLWCGKGADLEVDEVGSTDLEMLGLDECPGLLMVWEGVWLPSAPDHEGVSDDVDAVGKFRPLTPGEMACVQAGVVPWVPDWDEINTKIVEERMLPRMEPLIGI